MKSEVPEDESEIAQALDEGSYNGGGGEQQREHGGDELEQADGGCSAQQGPCAAQVHLLQLSSKQADSHHPQSPAQQSNGSLTSTFFCTLPAIQAGYAASLNEELIRCTLEESGSQLSMLTSCKEIWRDKIGESRHCHAPEDLKPAQVKAAQFEGHVSSMEEADFQQWREERQQVEDIPKAHHHCHLGLCFLCKHSCIHQRDICSEIVGYRG